MFLWAAGDSDRQGIRLTGSAAEHYQRNARSRRGSIVCMHVHVCMYIMCVCAGVHVPATVSANVS